MSGIVPESVRQSFTDFINVADKDSRTTGLCILMVAPMSSGQARETMLICGKIDTEPLFDHLVNLAARGIAKHAEKGDRS